MDPDPKSRLLSANLIDEENGEFAEAMGFKRVQKEDGSIVLEVDPTKKPNLIKAADAIGDLLVVVYCAAVRLGINAYDIFREVNRSNMTKRWPDGTIHRRESDNKVIKPPTYSPANIAKILSDATERVGLDWLLNNITVAKQAVSQGQDPWNAVVMYVCGETFKFTYQLIAQARILKDNSSFAGVHLCVAAIKAIAKTQGGIKTPEALAEEIRTDLFTATQIYDLYSFAFPGIVPIRDGAERQGKPAIVKNPAEVSYGQRNTISPGNKMGW